MSKVASRRCLVLSAEIRREFERIVRSRSEPATRCRRARILLLCADGKRIAEIVSEMGTNRPLVERVLDKALGFGPLQALQDSPRVGRPIRMTDDAKSWVLSVACSKPAEFGYAQESWTYSLLIKHIRGHAAAAGHECLLKIGKGRLHSILSRSNIRPHKISYYLERKDPDFDAKMADVLCVYKEVEMMNASAAERRSVTISYDEKPGIQAIANIAAELRPVPGRYATTARDYEYKRLGTVSLLAAIDLHTGYVIPLVRDRHRSCEFVEFLGIVDGSYHKDWRIRVILDNHSAHISKETQRYLRTKPGRFEFVFTPKHGSWLNLIEVFFSKLSRSLLRSIRVQSKDELVNRLYRGIAEMNQEPVVFRWRYKMSENVLA